MKLFLQKIKKRIKDSRAYKPLYMIQKYVECITMLFRAPKFIDVELSSLCNFKCLKCPTYEGSRPRGFMEDQTFKKILKDLSDTNWKVVLNLTGSGEVILHPHIVHFIETAKKVPQVDVIQIATNGYALIPSLAKDLIDAGVDRFKISLDTDDKDEFRAINRVDGLTQVEENIRWISNYVKENKKSTKIELKITCYKNNSEKMNRLIKKWEKTVHDIRATNLHNWGGLRGQKNETRTSPCRILFHMIQVRWDGSFTLCCCDVMRPTYNFGNIAQNTLKTYWNKNTDLKAAKKNHLSKNFETLTLCKTCTLDEPEYETFFAGSQQSGQLGV